MKQRHQAQGTSGSGPAAAADELEVFVVAHDPAIIAECEAQRRFACLPRCRYLLVGRGFRDLEQSERILVVERLPDNIEKHKHLLSFTAWYAVARNRLARTRFVSFVEYDVEIAPDFHQRSLEALRQRRRIVGYVPWSLSHPRYLYGTHWFPDALAEVYRLNAEALIDRHLRAGGADLWTATTNLAMSLADLYDFVDWFLPLTRVFRHDPVGGHVHERMIPIYCILNDIEICSLPALLTHHQKASHGTRTLPLKEVERIARTRRTGGAIPGAV